MHGEEVAQIESNNRFDAVQRQRDTNQTTGPGRGLFQYEVAENAMGGAKGSGASKTALTRYKQFYKHYGQEIPQQYAEELKESIKIILIFLNCLESCKKKYFMQIKKEVRCH